MTVTLTPDQEKFIAERLGRGEYSSPEKLVTEGLKLIQAKEDYQRQLDHLRNEIDIGLEQAKRGELLDGPTVMKRLLEKNRQRVRPQ